MSLSLGHYLAAIRRDVTESYIDVEQGILVAWGCGRCPRYGEGCKTCGSFGITKHFMDIYQLNKANEEKYGKRTDTSRVDSMTAVRMRATGHSRETIRAAIEIMAPKMREATGQDVGSHVWADYAARTAGFAFGAEGDRQIQKYAERLAEKWSLIERPPKPDVPIYRGRPISERARRRMKAQRRGRIEPDFDR